MILPPFFGYNLKYDDQDIYKLYSSYLSQDLLSYTKPTKTVIQTYLSQDVLTYTKQSPLLNITYLSNDVLTFQRPTKQLGITYAGIDVLSYDPPPTVPSPPNYISAKDWDKSADVVWTQPSSPRAPVTGYDIQYSTGDFTNWTDFKLTTNLFQVVTGLTNNTQYKFRVAGINSFGTGQYAISNTITPSGGSSVYCNLALYLPLNNDIVDESCSVKNTDFYSPVPGSIEVTLSDYKYGNASLVMNTGNYTNNEYPHLVVGSGQNINWNFSGNFTIEMFVKPFVNGAQGTFLSIGQETNGSELIRFYSDGSSIIFDFNSNTNNNTIISSGVSLSSGSWSHLAVVRSNNTIRMYINGQYSSNSVNTSIYPTLTGIPLRLGVDRESKSNPFFGYMDQVMIFNAPKYRGNFVPSEYTESKDCNCGYNMHIANIDKLIYWE
jgi:hypothetical protein